MDKELQLGSYIKLLPPHEKAGKYAFLLNFNNEKEAWHALLIEEKEFAFVPESELTLMPCFHFTTEAMQKLLRYEHTSSDYEGKNVPKGNWDYPEVYEYTLADMQALLLNLQEKKPTDQEYSAWASFLFQDFVMEEAFCCKGEPAYDTTRKIPLTGDFYPKNDAAMAQELFSTFIGESLRDETEGINIPKMLEDIDNYQHQRPIKPYFWSQENKENALPSRLSDPSRSPEEQEELRQLVLALAESLYPKAVEELGYSYYGGNDLFPCDWEKARDCFLNKASPTDAFRSTDTAGRVTSSSFSRRKQPLFASSSITSWQAFLRRQRKSSLLRWVSSPTKVSISATHPYGKS